MAEQYKGQKRRIAIQKGEYDPDEFFSSERKLTNKLTNGGKKLTNADAIRAMGDEDLAEFAAMLGCHPSARRETCRGVSQCPVCWLGWLKQEVDDAN